MLKRPEQRLATGLSLDATDRFLAALASTCEPVELYFQWRPQLCDAADEMLLKAALNGRAEALVTYILRDFFPAATHFDLRVLRPGQLLKELRS